MADGEIGTSRRFSSIMRWSIWLTFLAVWTAGLLIPTEHTGLLTPDFVVSRKFIVAKSLHVLGYFCLSLLSGWLRIPLRYRLLLLFGIMFHATLTEVLQVAISNRTGLLTDVLLDQAGISVGLIVSWKWWTNSGD